MTRLLMGFNFGGMELYLRRSLGYGGRHGSQLREEDVRQDSNDLRMKR